MIPAEVLEGIEDRIRDASDRYASLMELAQEERQRRSVLIMAAIDYAGVSQVRAAAAAGISRAEVHRIICEDGLMATAEGHDWDLGRFSACQCGYCDLWNDYLR